MRFPGLLMGDVRRQQICEFVLPSLNKNWGDVNLEGRTFGLPCVDVYGRHMEEIFIHGETGVLVKAEQPETLAKAIIQLFGQPEMRARMGQAAHRLVAQEFTWDRVVDRLSPILSTAVLEISVSSRYSSIERKLV